MLSFCCAPYHAILSVGYKLVLLERIRLKLWLLFDEAIVIYIYICLIGDRHIIVYVK
jgi:hypothetical protein